MHSLKILPLSPPSPPPRPALQPRIPRRLSVLRCPAPRSLRTPALSRRHRSPRTLRAVIVVLVLWLVRETFSDLLLG